MKALYLDGKRVVLDPAAIIGAGGEAEVYDLGDGRALKVFKQPDHPDLASQPAEQIAAQARLDVHQNKLRDFPTSSLPEGVITPQSLATRRKRGGPVVGYAMQLVPRAELLYRYGEPRVRRTLPGNQVVGVLCDLCDTVSAIHDAGVVIGDFNDLNVLVSGHRAHLIDADSFQFGSYPCSVYSERFVDPTLCDPNEKALILTGHHRTSSDWYAFAVMVMRSLLCVGPYGGVYRPKNAKKRIAHSARPLHRITVFDPEVVYPRPALHFCLLPDDLVGFLHSVFVEDRRIPFPAHLLDDLRWTRCRSCGAEHARASCPACQGGRGKKPKFSRVRGRVTADEVFGTDGAIAAAKVTASGLRWLYVEDGKLKNRHGDVIALPEAADPTRRYACNGDGAFVIEPGRVTAIEPRGQSTVHTVDPCAGDIHGEAGHAANQHRSYWLRGGRLLRTGSLGEVALGDVLRGQTRIWAGDRFGFGFYRAGNVSVGFVFDADKPGIDDSIALPRIRGSVIDAHCAIAKNRAWLSWTEARGGKARCRCVVIACSGRRGGVVAHAGEGSGETDWLQAMPGACAVGDFLFVPTDRGIVRVEADGDRLRVTRSFPDTEPFVDSSAQLLAGGDGLYVVTGRRITRLQLA